MDINFIIISAYIIFIVIYIVFSIAGIYHLWRFGYKGDLTKMAIFIYVTISFLIISTTFFVLSARLIGG